MIKTYDFILTAKQNKAFMKQLEDAMSGKTDCIIDTDIHQLRFQAEKQTVIVAPKSETSDFQWKIVPKEITYRGLALMLHGDWEHICQDDIMDI